MSLLLSLLLWTFLGLPLSLAALLLAWLLYHQIRNTITFATSGIKNIPRVPERPLIGAFRLMPPHEAELDNFRRFGKVYVTTVITEPHIVLADPELNQLVLAHKNFPKSPVYSRLLDFWGANLGTLQHTPNGGKWKPHRVLLDPVFKLQAIKSLNDGFARHTEQFVTRLLAHVDASSSGKRLVNMADEVTKWALDIISMAGFGFDLGASSGIGENSPVLDAMHRLLAQTASPLLLIPFGGKIMKFLQRKNRAILNQVFEEVINRRIEELQETARKGGAAATPPTRHTDLLDMMLRPSDDGQQLTKQEILDELFVFFFAGHETSAATMAFALFELGKNRDVYEKLQSEVDEVLGPLKKGQPVVCPTAEQLESMKYLEMVLNETLRLYPPANGVGRTIAETFEHNGMVFPKGMTIAPNMLLTHRNPELWPDPLRFDPDRFTKENSEGRHPYAFFPFSGGPRICIGKRFFLNETKVFLATLLHQLDFTLEPSKANVNGVLNSMEGLMKTKDVWVNFSRRV